MKFPSLDDAAARLVEALDARPLAHRPLVLCVGEDARELGTLVGARLGAKVEVPRVERLALPWYPRLGFGALTADNHHYVDPIIAADHALGAREVAQLCRERLPPLRGASWRRPAPLGEVSAVVVARALSTGYRALAVCASARAGGAREILVATPCAARDAIDRVESAAPLIVLVAGDGPRFDPDDFLPPATEQATVQS